MSEDHLDKETSLSVQMSDSGIKAGAKSRFIAAIDRLGGNVVDVFNAHIEAETERRRAKTKGEVDLIDAISQYAAEHLGANPKNAERAAKKHFRKILAEQENSDGVLKAALEDLRESPPTEESSADQAELSQEFMDRLERYSETASTDELRQRWGRVLASEIRTPGTFSGKVLRVVDELQSETAILFERLCQHRIDDLLPLCLIDELSYTEKTKLIVDDLIIDPGINTQFREYQKVCNDGGHSIQITGVSKIGAVSFPQIDVINISDAKVLLKNKDGYGLPALLLTDAGKSIASILQDKQFDALNRYAEALKNGTDLPHVTVYKQHESGYLPKRIV